jgi:3-deoxy-D-manno-octulosonate 8-phosphate phosphatase (KDO 8-P phosphatase)
VAILSDDELARRAARLEWLLFDVDGVMTDGRLVYGADGEQWKVFDVRDGLGMKLAQRSGLKVGVLSGRITTALEVRARELGVNALIMDRSDKGPAFAEFLATWKTSPERVAYVGDDLVDLPVIRRCGLSFAPADAVAEVLARVDCVLARRGGQGAVREMCERVLKARNAWEGLLAPYLEGE